MSWAFHWFQKRSPRINDLQTQSIEDYSIQLLGLPKDLVSEKELKTLLEKELNMSGKIHGVSICYDLLSLSEEDQERIRDMIENVVEYDDLRNGWCPENLSRPVEDLEKCM